MSIQRKRVERLAHQLLHGYMRKISATKDQTMLRTKGWCEFCGQTKDVWDIVLVEQSDKALEIALKFPEQMACRDCIREHGLVEAESREAIEFEASNLAVKWLLRR